MTISLPSDRSWVEASGAMAFNGPMSIDATTATANGREVLDQALVSIGASRDRGAFALVFRHFAPRLRAFMIRGGCDRGDAEEIVQEVMVTVWRRAETFDPRQASASTWIFTIARNRRIDRLRRERRPELDPNDPALVPDAPRAADQSLALAQDTERLESAIATLPQEQRDILERAYYDEKPHSVIAEETGLPLGTVKSRLRLALGRLRKEVRENG